MGRLADHLHAGGRRMLRHGATVLVAALAAAVAYALASALFGAQNAFFAPIAAIISVGLSGGNRLQRTLEIAGGVLLGVLAAEIVALIPAPMPVTLALAVALGRGAAVVVRASGLFANQAAVAAVVTTVLTPVTQASPFLRVADAVVGGIVALAVAVASSFRPDRTLAGAVNEATSDLAAEIERTAAALRQRPEDIDAAVRGVRAAAGSTQALGDAIESARESVRLGRRRRNVRRMLSRTARVRHEWLDLTASLLSVARSARAMLREGEPATGVAARLDELAGAVRDIGDWASAQGRADGIDVIRARLRKVASRLTADLRGEPTPSARVALSSSRAAVVDLMRMTGMSHADAVAIATA